MRLVFGVFTLFLFIIHLTSGLDCRRFTPENCPKRNNTCHVINNKCTCASTVEIEIVFVVDSSGSVSRAGFDSAKKFITSYVTSSVSTSTKIGIINFSSDIKTILTLRENNYNILQKIKNMKWLDQLTHTKDAIVAMNRQFESIGTTGKQRIGVLLTDGYPVPGDQDPCLPWLMTKTIETNNIRMMVVGIGKDLSLLNSMSCLVKPHRQSTDMFDVSSYKEEDLEKVFGFLSEVTCPVDFTLETTEVKVERDLLDTTGNNTGRFLEVLNTGPEFPLRRINATGFVNAIEFKGDNTKVGQGKYLVFYEKGKGFDFNSVTCQDCSCTKDASPKQRWCKDAVYFECCSQKGNACPCYFAPMNMTSWKQSFQSDKIIDSVEYGAGWPTAKLGYSYELQSITYDNSKGLSWGVSCNYHGTPGWTPVTNCTKDCEQGVCGKYDKGARCTTESAETGTKSYCQCSPGHYNPSKLRETCIPIPPPMNCSIDFLRINETYSAHLKLVGPPVSKIYSFRFSYRSSENELRILATGARSYIFTDISIFALSLVNGTYGYAEVIIDNEVSKKKPCVATKFSPTMRPTRYPSRTPSRQPTSIPTSAPTYAAPKVFFKRDCAKDRCECSGESLLCCLSMTTNGNETVLKQVNNSQCVEGNKATELWAGVNEYDYLKVKKERAGFPFPLNISYKITWKGDEYANAKQTTFRNNNNTQGYSNPAVYITPMNGTVLSTDYDSGLASIKMELKDSVGVVSAQSSAEYKVFSVYEVELLGCSIDGNYTDGVCSVVYPKSTILRLQFKKNTNAFVKKVVPAWVWPLVIGSAIFLVGLAALLYLYWIKAAHQKSLMECKDDELMHAMLENEAGIGGDVGQDVVANPLATGVPGMIAQSDAVGKEITKLQDINSDIAGVNVERFVHKEEVGQRGAIPISSN